MKPSLEKKLGKVTYNEQVIELSGGTNEKYIKLVEGELTELTKDDWEGITKTKSYTFGYSTKLLDVYIPSGVSLAGYLFARCTALKTIFVEEGVTNIPISCFYYCDSVEYVDLPSTISRIETSAFALGTAGKPFNGTIKIRATTPPSLRYHWSSPTQSSLPYYGNYTIEVPAGSLEAYKTETNWSTYDVDNGGPATFVEFEEE